jgi:hypothetical protein
MTGISGFKIYGFDGSLLARVMDVDAEHAEAKWNRSHAELAGLIEELAGDILPADYTHGIRHSVSPSGVDHLIINGRCATCGNHHEWS